MIWSFEVRKQNSPQLAAYYRHVTKAEKAPSARSPSPSIRRQSRAAADRRPAAGAAQALVARHRQEGVKRDVTQTSLEPPLGSGPYRLKDFAPGRTVVYEKRRRTTGARASTPPSAPTTSRRSATNISATRRSRSRPSRAIRSIGAPRTAPRIGRPPTTSRPCATSAW